MNYKTKSEVRFAATMEQLLAEYYHQQLLENVKRTLRAKKLREQQTKK